MFLIINAPYLSSQLSQRFSKKVVFIQVYDYFSAHQLFFMKTSMPSENAVQRNLLR